MKKTILLLVMVFLVSCTGTSDSGEKLSMTKDEGIFRVGMECGYAPYNWTQMDDSNGAVKIQGEATYAGGYDVEFAKKIADGLGMKLEIVKVSWDGLEPALRSGKIDAIIAGMSPDKTRKENADFTEAYYHSDLVMIVKAGSQYEKATSLEDFKGAKITAQQGTLHYPVIDQISEVVKEAPMADFSAMRVALESGVIDGYVSERPEGISAKMANPVFTFVDFEENKGFEISKEETSIAVALRKESELTEKINVILRGISEEERAEMMDSAIEHQPAAQ